MVTNALQNTHPGGKVTVTLARDDQNALVQVQDTGIGIALEDLSHIFERFYRISPDRSRQSGGVGLGLAIAQAIAKAHKGNLSVQSEFGQGSVFTIQLPLKLNITY